MLIGCRDTDNKNRLVLHPHPAQFGCSCTRGNNTYLLCLAVLMETHQSSREGGWGVDALFFYTVALFVVLVPFSLC